MSGTSQPYHKLRACMSSTAQEQAAQKADRMICAMLGPTPAQLAYAAYQAALPERAYFPAPAWTVLDVAYQRAWEAAAQAVLTMKQEEERDAFA